MSNENTTGVDRPHQMIDPEMQEMLNDSSPAKTLPQDADLSQLCNFGALTKDVSVGGFIFKLKTLNSGEQERCLAAVSRYNLATLVVATALQNHTLAFGVVSVNGVPLKDLPLELDNIKDEELRKLVEAGDENAKKLAVVRSWQDGLRSMLFHEHQELVGRSEEIITGISSENLKE